MALGDWGLPPEDLSRMRTLWIEVRFWARMNAGGDAPEAWARAHGRFDAAVEEIVQTTFEFGRERNPQDHTAAGLAPGLSRGSRRKPA